MRTNMVLLQFLLKLTGMMGTKPGKWTSWILLIGAVLLMFFVLRHRRDPGSKMPVVSILEQTQYFEELALVGYHSDQMVGAGR